VLTKRPFFCLRMTNLITVPCKRPYIFKCINPIFPTYDRSYTQNEIIRMMYVDSLVLLGEHMISKLLSHKSIAHIAI
jgi:hypothetical protein